MSLNPQPQENLYPRYGGAAMYEPMSQDVQEMGAEATPRELGAETKPLELPNRRDSNIPVEIGSS